MRQIDEIMTNCYYRVCEDVALGGRIMKGDIVEINNKCVYTGEIGLFNGDSGPELRIASENSEGAIGKVVKVMIFF